MKKRKTGFLIIFLGLIIIGGCVYLLLGRNSYESFVDIIKEMDVSAEREQENIKKLEAFSKENDYDFTAVNESGTTKVMVVSKDHLQNFLYSVDEQRLWFKIMAQSDQAVPEKEKLEKVNVGDSFDKVIEELGDPNGMSKDKDNLTILSWENDTERVEVLLKENQVTEIREN